MKPLKFLPYFFMCAALIGCEKPPLGPQVSLNESEFRDFSLDARTISFKSKYEHLTTNLYVNELMSSVEAWAKAHFKTTASQGEAFIEFDEISAEDIPLQVKNNSLFVSEQAGKLEATIAMKVSIQNARGFKEKYLEVRTTRSHTYPAKATLLDKEKIWKSVVNSVINSLNAKFKEALGD